MKWNGWANDDDLAMEFTPNFNDSPGRLPGRPEQQLRQLRGRDRAAAPRATSPSSPVPPPAPGTTTPSCSTRRRRPPKQVVPYVDGKAGRLHQGREAAPARRLRQLGARLHVARRLRPVRRRRPRRGRALRPGAERERRSPTTIQGIVANQRPIASFHAPATAKVGETGQLRRLRLQRPRRHRSPSTNGTSTATAAMRPAPARRRRSATPTRPPARSQVGLRVTDDAGATAITSRTRDRASGEGGGGEEERAAVPATAYRDGVLATPACSTTGAWVRHPARPSPTASAPARQRPLGEPTLGVAGRDHRRSRHGRQLRRRQRRRQRRRCSLAGKTAITVEFWMKWNAWANDDDLAMELHANFNDNAGGFLVDPNSSYGSFAVGIGQRRLAQRRPLRPALAPAPGTTTPSSSTRTAPAGEAGRPLRRRHSRSPSPRPRTAPARRHFANAAL